MTHCENGMCGVCDDCRSEVPDPAPARAHGLPQPKELAAQVDSLIARVLGLEGKVRDLEREASRPKCPPIIDGACTRCGLMPHACACPAETLEERGLRERDLHATIDGLEEALKKAEAKLTGIVSYARESASLWERCADGLPEGIQHIEERTACLARAREARHIAFVFGQNEPKPSIGVEANAIATARKVRP